MRSSFFTSVAAAGFLAAFSLCASASVATDKVASFVFSKTGMKAESVKATPIPGLFEVVTGRRIYYTDAEAKHIVVGQIFDTNSQTNITARRLEELSHIDWKKLPLNDAIKVVYGTGKRQVAVFTDARCSYCRMLETNLKEASNVTVYNFVFPILNSREVSRNIICSSNPAKVFQAHMLEGAEPAIAKCDDSVLDRNLKLAERFGITGTPAIIFPNGKMQPGAMSTAELNEALQQ